MKKFSFLVAISLLLVSCSKSDAKFASILEAKESLESKDYTTLFQTDSTLVYMTNDTIFTYHLNRNYTDYATKDHVLNQELGVDLTKLYPMEILFDNANYRILPEDNLFEILLSKNYVYSDNNIIIFSINTESEEYDESNTALYSFTVTSKDDLAPTPILRRLTWDSPFTLNDSVLSFKVQTNSSQFPASFTDALNDIIGDNSIKPLFNDGCCIISEIRYNIADGTFGVEPVHICFGTDKNVIVPIYDYGDNIDLLQAITNSL